MAQDDDYEEMMDVSPPFPYGGLRLASLAAFRARPSSRQVRAVLFSNAFQALIGVMIVYGVIIDDLRVLVFPKEGDFAVSVTTIVVAIVFLLELVLLSVYEQGYLLSFYWVCDAVASITLLFDVHFLAIARYARLARFLRITRVSLRVSACRQRHGSMPSVAT